MSIDTPRDTRRLAALLSLAIASTLNTAHAAEQTADKDSPQTMKSIKVEAGVDENGSVAAGYRSDEVSQVGPWQRLELQELPYSITVLSAELIDNVQAINSDQLFRINPTTQLRRSQHENDQSGVNLRGFNVQTFYRDGMPGDQYGHGTTTEDVEQIEILTGLSGFLYGPGNVGGVVNYVTKRPSVDRINNVTFGTSGGSNLYLKGDFGGPIDADGRFGYRVNAVKQGGETAIENQDVDKDFISAAFDWHLTDTLLLQVNASDRKYVVDGAQAYWGLASGVRRPSADRLDTSYSYGQPWTRRNYENEMWGARLRWQASDSLTFRAAWFHNDNVREMGSATNTIQANGTYSQSISGLYAAGIDPMLSESDDDRGQAFADFQFTTGAIEHKMTAGVLYTNNLQIRYASNGPNINFANGGTLNDPIYQPRPSPASLNRGVRVPVIDSTSVTWSVGDDITFNERWSMLAGLGHSTIDEAEITAVFASPGYKKSVVTPTLSVLFKPAGFITTYASYIEALERGGAAGEFFNGMPVVNAGQVFEPLTSEQFEIGAKATLGGVLLTTALFQIDKALQYYDIRDPANPRFVQDGRQVHKGIEVTAFGKLTERLALIGGLTWLDAEISQQRQQPALEGKRPTVVSKTFAKLHLEYELPMLPLTLSGGVNYNSRQFGDALNTDVLPAYTLVDVGARYETPIGDSMLTLRLDAYNLTDKHYWANNAYLGDPRSIAVSASVAF